MDEGADCPLCLEQLDPWEARGSLCQCGYTVCLWCYHRLQEDALKESLPARCPNCRTVYDAESIKKQQIDPQQLELMKKDKKPDKKKEAGALKPRKDLHNVRVVQRNLVYAVGLAMELCYEDILKGPNYFGQFGRVVKISVSRSGPYGTNAAKHGPTGSAYVTYRRAEDAERCIQTIHNTVWEGKPVKACFGTTKYCNAWLKGLPCNNTDCLYLHDIADDEDSYTKEETKTAKFNALVHAAAPRAGGPPPLPPAPSTSAGAAAAVRPVTAARAIPGAADRSMAVSASAPEPMSDTQLGISSTSPSTTGWPSLGSNSWAAKAVLPPAAPAAAPSTAAAVAVHVAAHAPPPPPLPPPPPGDGGDQEWPSLGAAPAAASSHGPGQASTSGRKAAAPPPNGLPAGTTMAAQLARSASMPASGKGAKNALNGSTAEKSTKQLTALSSPHKPKLSSKAAATAQSKKQEQRAAAAAAASTAPAAPEGSIPVSTAAPSSSGAPAMSTAGANAPATDIASQSAKEQQQQQQAQACSSSSRPAETPAAHAPESSKAVAQAKVEAKVEAKAAKAAAEKQDTKAATPTLHVANGPAKAAKGAAAEKQEAKAQAGAGSPAANGPAQSARGAHAEPASTSAAPASAEARQQPQPQMHQQPPAGAPAQASSGPSPSQVPFAEAGAAKARPPPGFGTAAASAPVPNGPAARPAKKAPPPGFGPPLAQSAAAASALPLAAATASAHAPASAQPSSVEAAAPPQSDAVQQAVQPAASTSMPPAAVHSAGLANGHAQHASVGSRPSSFEGMPGVIGMAGLWESGAPASHAGASSLLFATAMSDPTALRHPPPARARSRFDFAQDHDSGPDPSSEAAPLPASQPQQQQQALHVQHAQQVHQMQQQQLGAMMGFGQPPAHKPQPPAMPAALGPQDASAFFRNLLPGVNVHFGPGPVPHGAVDPAMGFHMAAQNGGMGGLHPQLPQDMQHLHQPLQHHSPGQAHHQLQQHQQQQQAAFFGAKKLNLHDLFANGNGHEQGHFQGAAPAMAGMQGSSLNGPPMAPGTALLRQLQQMQQGKPTTANGHAGSPSGAGFVDPAILTARAAGHPGGPQMWASSNAMAPHGYPLPHHVASSHPYGPGLAGHAAGPSTYMGSASECWSGVNGNGQAGGSLPNGNGPSGGGAVMPAQQEPEQGVVPAQPSSAPELDTPRGKKKKGKQAGKPAGGDSPLPAANGNIMELQQQVESAKHDVAAKEARFREAQKRFQNISVGS